MKIAGEHSHNGRVRVNGRAENGHERIGIGQHVAAGHLSGTKMRREAAAMVGNLTLSTGM